MSRPHSIDRVQVNTALLSLPFHILYVDSHAEPAQDNVMSPICAVPTGGNLESSQIPAGSRA